MQRKTVIKLAVAALVAGAVTGGIGVGRAQVVTGSDATTTTTSTTISAGTSISASVEVPTQTG